MSGALAIMESGQTAGSTQCAGVVLSPSSGTTPLTVNLSTTQTGGHIFYTRALSTIDYPDPVPPTHSGDVATGTTVRIGTTSGNVNTSSQYCTIAAITVDPAGILADSDMATSSYAPPAP